MAIDIDWIFDQLVRFGGLWALTTVTYYLTRAYLQGQYPLCEQPWYPNNPKPTPIPGIWKQIGIGLGPAGIALGVAFTLGVSAGRPRSADRSIVIALPMLTAVWASIRRYFDTQARKLRKAKAALRPLDTNDD